MTSRHICRRSRWRAPSRRQREDCRLRAMIEAVDAALGLGGNIGDVRDTFRLALNALGQSAGVAVLATSSLYRTQPWGPIAQPSFLNMAVLARTTLSPHQLLDL